MIPTSDSSVPPIASFGGGTMLGSTASIQAGDTVFSRYTLKKVLGVGGMGVVWLANDSKLDKEVALKFIPEALRHDPDAINDLKAQTKLGLNLVHKNIVSVRGFEDDERLAAIVMEYVDGATLASMRVDQPAQVFEADSLHVYLLHILEALEYAHEQEKIVHRDLKPANVMVNSQDQVKVADFGIACSIRNSVGRVMSMPQRSASGTLHYMSPQQLLGAPGSVSDDIYSLGATIFELMTGTPPFHTGDIGTQIREIPAPSMSQRRLESRIDGEEIPQAWEEVVAAALAKDPALRPGNVGEFRKGLLGEPFRRGTGTGQPSAAAQVFVPRASPPTPPPPAVARHSPVSVTVLLAASVAVIAAGAALYFATNQPPAPVPAVQSDAIPKSKVQHYVDQELSATTFEKSEATLASKRDKWDRLVTDLRMIDYQKDDRLREIMRHAEDRMDSLKQEEDRLRQQYQVSVQSLRSAIEAARRESETRDVGAAAKAAAWNNIIAKNAALMNMADLGTDHIALLEEARTEAATWQKKSSAETPSVAPPESAVFALSHAVAWSDEGRKKLLQTVQAALTQRGHPTGAADGSWGVGTFQAIVAWQKDEKLPATGVLDMPTLSRLGLNMMQDVPQVKVVNTGGGSSSAGSRPAGGSSSNSGKPSWEDVAKMKVLQGGSPPVPIFRP